MLKLNLNENVSSSLSVIRKTKQYKLSLNKYKSNKIIFVKKNLYINSMKLYLIIIKLILFPAYFYVKE